MINANPASNVSLVARGAPQLATLRHDGRESLAPVASSCAVKYHAEFNERAGRIFLCHRDSAPTGVGDPPERLLYQRFSSVT